MMAATTITQKNEDDKSEELGQSSLDKNLPETLTLSPGQTDRQYYEQYWSRAERKTKRGK
jgi:hypothetical protein